MAEGKDYVDFSTDAAKDDKLRADFYAELQKNDLKATELQTWFHDKGYTAIGETQCAGIIERKDDILKIEPLAY